MKSNSTSTKKKNVLVCQGKQTVRFPSTQFKIRRSVLTVPSCTAFKKESEVAFEVEFPSAGKNKKQSPAKCRGIVLDCRPQRKKGMFEVDLMLTQVPVKYMSFFDDIRPHLPLCMDIPCSACSWYKQGKSGTRGDCSSIQEFKSSLNR